MPVNQTVGGLPIFEEEQSGFRSQMTGNCTDIRLTAVGGKALGTSEGTFHNFMASLKRIRHRQYIIRSLNVEATSAVALNGGSKIFYY